MLARPIRLLTYTDESSAKLLHIVCSSIIPVSYNPVFLCSIPLGLNFPEGTNLLEWLYCFQSLAQSLQWPSKDPFESERNQTINQASKKQQMEIIVSLNVLLRLFILMNAIHHERQRHFVEH